MLLVDATALNRLNAKLVEYQKVNGRYTIPEVLEKKGTDLRLQVWRLFWDQKYGGKGRKKEGIAFAELKRRSKAGLGTRVREKELLSKWGGAPELANGRKRKGYKLSNWQKLVWQETERRQSGVGVLAIGFLSKEFQRGFKSPMTSKKMATESKSFGTMVALTLDVVGQSFTIEGHTPWLDEIANRYNIGNRAIAEVEKDLDVYLDRKFEEARKRVFGN